MAVGGTLPKTEFAAQGGVIDLPVAPAMRLVERKRGLPHALTAVFASLFAAGILFFVFGSIMHVGPFYSSGISFAVFVCSSILLYSHLESKNAS